MRLSIVLVIASLSLAIGAAVIGVVRIGMLADHEVNVFERATLRAASERDDATAQSAPLAAFRLERDHQVRVDLCAGDPMRPERWAGTMGIAFWRPRAQQLLHRTELDPTNLGFVRRNESQGCLLIARGTIEATDDYAVDAVYDTRPDEIAGIPLVVQVSATHPLGGMDLALVIFAWLGSIGVVLALLVAPPASAEVTGNAALEAELEAPRKPIRPELRVVLGLLLVVGAFFGSSWIPGGAALSLAIALALAGLEIAVAFGLSATGVRRAAIGLSRAKGWWWHIPFAIVGGIALGYAAQLATLIVPSTSESAIEEFVSFPSGLLSFALLGVIAPFAEEIFFRGFVYGALRERSRVLAFVGAWLLFVLAHVPQTFGQWGAVVAIGVMGLGLTTMRAITGSTLVPALAHLTYNGLIAIQAVAA